MMDINELNKELIKVKKLIPEIEKNPEKRVRNLSSGIRRNLFNIRVLPTLTSGGLETCETILKYLYWAEYLIDKELKKRSGFFKEEKETELKAEEVATKTQIENYEAEKFPFQHSSLNPRRSLPSPIKPRPETPKKISFMQKIISGLPAEKKDNIIQKETELTLKSNLPIKSVTKNLYKKIKITPPEPKTIDFGPYYDKNK